MQRLVVIVVLQVDDKSLLLAPAELVESCRLSKVGLLSVVHFNGHLHHLSVSKGTLVSQIAERVAAVGLSSAKNDDVILVGGNEKLDIQRCGRSVFHGWIHDAEAFELRAKRFAQRVWARVLSIDVAIPAR